jgi:hypothetical protein
MSRESWWRLERLGNVVGNGGGAWGWPPEGETINSFGVIVMRLRSRWREWNVFFYTEGAEKNGHTKARKIWLLEEVASGE